jgi:DNA-binding MarR family transcriptional regulator
LDAELAAAGFEDQALPDGRVLRICEGSAAVTTSQIGRELSISRQGAAKIVNSLQKREYVTLVASPTSGREKIVALTPRGTAYLVAQRKAARRIERQVRSEVGAELFDGLFPVLAAIAGGEQPRMREYLRRARELDDLGYVER